MFDDFNERSLRDMTRQELIALIRRDTVYVNERIEEYRELGDVFKDVEQAIQTMRTNAGTTRGRLGQEIGVGRVTSKNKAGLIVQARELENFLKWDIISTEGQRQLQEREMKEWETFHERYPSMSYDEWRVLVETFGAVGSAILEQYGSHNVRKLHEEVMQKNPNINMANEMIRLYNKLIKGGKSITQERLMDALRASVFSQLNND